MATGRLPDEGPVRLGPVTLPAGRLITGYPELAHVAWVTADPRFGARLIAVGDVDLGLFVERPPRTLQAAQRIAAEQAVLADKCIAGAKGISSIAERLVNSPVWTFWWD